MAFCDEGKDRFDVFLSYSRDDDSRHNQWISDFEKYLKDKVVAQLRITSDVFRDRASLFRVCRDETGFPASGDLVRVIDDMVRRSRFLIIFLGSGYLNSEWCLSEIDTFRETAGGTFQDAKKRLYLIVLDSVAVKKLQEGDEPVHLPENRRKLWKDLQGLARQVIRVEDFLRDDKLVPVYLDRDENRADPYFHEHCMPLIEEFAEKLVECRSQRVSKPAPSTSAWRIVIGAVPPHLTAARDALRDALVASLDESQVLAIDAADLADTDTVRDWLRDARTLVQPLDDRAPIARRGDPAGGHLMIQQQLLQEARVGADAGDELPLVWWKPPGTGSTGGGKLEDFDRVFVDALENKIRRCEAGQLADELAGKAISGSGSGDASRIAARVWVEWQESDEGIIKAAKAIVRDRFDRYSAVQASQGRVMNASLVFGEADWELLSGEILGTLGSDRPQGVIIVYNENKDFNALREQEQTISNLDSVLQEKTFPGLFYMRRSGWYSPGDYWRVVRFLAQDHHLNYKPQEVEEFVMRLFEIIWKNL